MLKTLKKKLKKNQFFYKINAWYKARRNIKRLAKLASFYSSCAKARGMKYSPAEIPTLVQDRLAARGISLEKKKGKKLRIFWVGANLPQDESGFLQNLKKFGEVIVFKNHEGGYGLAGSTADQRDPSVLEIIKKNNETLLNQVSEAHKNGGVDLFLGQVWADVLGVEVLIDIQKMGIPTVNISMDDKLPDLWGSYQGRRVGSVGLVQGLDLVLTTTESVCEWYMVEGCPSIYWPLASDPEIFFPRSPKKHDVVFIGSNYGLRGALVAAIADAGIPISAFGPGFPNGPLGAEESGKAFGEAKIILGTGTIGYNDDVFTIKLRDFDAPMSGALYITHRNPDLLKIYKEGEEIECYADFDECIRKIKFYLTHPEKLQAIADAGLRRAKLEHTWEKRIHDTLKLIGFPL